MKKDELPVVKIKSEDEYKKLLSYLSQNNIAKLNSFFEVISDYLEMNERADLATHIENKKFYDAGLTHDDIDNIIAKESDTEEIK